MRNLICAIAMMLLTPAAAKDDAPISVEQIVKSPPQMLRHILVMGQVDSCSAGFSCHLCPAEMTRETLKWDQCLSLDFEGFAIGHNDETYVSAVGLMEKAFRFATVVMEADYDPTCARRGMCLDRAPVIVHAKVVQVLSRKTVRNGLTTDWNRLVEPDEADGAEMSKLILAGYPTTQAVKLFRLEGFSNREAGLIAVGLGCFCTKADCSKDWPEHYSPGFESPANPFSCSMMEKRAEGWRIRINN